MASDSSNGEVIVTVRASVDKFTASIKGAKAEANKFDQDTEKAAKGSQRLATESKTAADSIVRLEKAKAIAAQAAAKLAQADKRVAMEATKASQAATTLAKAEQVAAQTAARLANERERVARSELRSAQAATKFAQQNEKAARAAERAANKIKNNTSSVNKNGQAFDKAHPKIAKWRRTMKSAADSSALVTGPLGGIASRLSILGRITSATGVAVLGLSAAIGVVTIGMAASVREAEKFERSGFKVKAILNATGHAAGLTSKEIRDLSSEIALTTLASVEGVEAAATKLLTFKSVQGDVFKDALRLSQDLAEVGFGSVEAGAIQLGKALDDPAVGLSALKRIGVSFTVAQKEQIKAMQETGNILGAQEVIIRTLNSQVGGAGVAAAQGLAGAYDTLGQRTSEFGQNLANNTGALSAWTAVVNLAAQSVDNLNRRLFDTPQEKIQKLLALRQKLQSRLNVQESRGILGFGKQELQDQIDGINRHIAAIQNRRVEEFKEIELAREAAKVAAAEALAEAKKGAALEAAAAEAKRIKKLRESTIRDLRNEVDVLTSLQGLYADSTISLQDLAFAEEKQALLTRLNIDATSAQGKALVDLINKRHELQKAIETQTQAREDAKASASRIKAVKDDIVVTQMYTAAVGGSVEELRAAKVAAETYRLEQQLLAEALERTGNLTDAQKERIHLTAEAYGKVVGRLDEVTAAQDKAKEAAEKQQEKVKEFQESLADALTDSILGAESFEDALKSMILQMSRAIVQAEILKAIQGDLGTGGGWAGQGGALGIVTNAFSSMFGGGSTSTPMAATVGGISSVQASRMHQGGSVGAAGQTISVPPSTFINAPRFHNGLKPDEFPAILQKGEEVVPKDKVGVNNEPRQIINNFNIKTPDADSFRKSQRQLSRKLKQTTANS